MRGDFSTRTADAVERMPRSSNIRGVLHQQGKVLRDVDLTDSDLLAVGWQDSIAAAVIGNDVAAVPVDAPNGFRIEAARVTGPAATPRIEVTVHGGALWADGLPVSIGADPAGTVVRTATYFGPPVQSPAASPSSIGAGIRDAVVLETSYEELNAFQDPERLLEPALGGPDTAERIHTRSALRLYRLGPDETCCTIRSALNDGDTGRGRLTASLLPVTVVGGECPTVAKGGYTGFEHSLYRIEIAEVNPGFAPRFKYSWCNGGLVGRGTFRPAAMNPSGKDSVAIDANLAAIKGCGLTDFYLEALQFDTALGYWRTIYGVDATLDPSGQELELGAAPVLGTALPPAAAPTFFRLWNGIRTVASFTALTELADGITLQFDPPGSATYRPRDYWTFSVRAGEIANPATLIAGELPHGIEYHRVALAEIQWTAQRDTALGGTIIDCRRRFRPLTNQRVCCTILVGDGVRTFGDYNSLEEAALHLPASGGELCLLPGIHYANLFLENRRDVTIHGCPRRTMVLPRPAAPTQPIIRIRDGEGLRIHALDLVDMTGIPVVLEGSGVNTLQDVRIDENRMVGRGHVIRATNVIDAEIARNRLYLLDTRDGGPTLSLAVDQSLVERNTLLVWPAAAVPPERDDGGGRTPPNPADPCADLVVMMTSRDARNFARAAWRFMELGELNPDDGLAFGGIHLRAGCDVVRVLGNRIRGGAGNGITLGGAIVPADREQEKPVIIEGPPAEGSSGFQELPPAMAPGRYEFTVRTDAGAIQAGVDVLLRDGSGVVQHALSDGAGIARFSVIRGTSYSVGVGPGFELAEVLAGTITDNGVIRVSTFTLKLRGVRPAPSEPTGFLTEITIQDNEIDGMGLSGIGFGFHAGRGMMKELSGAEIMSSGFAASGTASGLFPGLLESILPGLSPRLLFAMTNAVHDLVIRENRIHDCLRGRFTDELLRDARRIGRGGISLGVVDGVVIGNNHIYNNGRQGSDPACGIYVAFGNDLDIAGNNIIGNGRPGADFERAKLEGVRGGIYVAFAGSLTRTYKGTMGRRPALRVHDNNVDQPAGRALTAFAFGPVLCANNYFDSDRSGQFGLWDRIVGGVLIVNLGGLDRMIRRKAAGFVSGKAEMLGAAAAFGSFTSLPGGETSFADNVCRVERDNRSFIGQLIFTLDDVGFGNNASASLQGGRLFANTVVLGASIRATASRFQEDTDRTLSLVTASKVMNTTVHNQGDHCIVVLPKPGPVNPGQLPTVDRPNQVLDYVVCQRSMPDKASFVRYAMAAYSSLAREEGFAVDPRTFETAMQAFLDVDALHAMAGAVYDGQVHRRMATEAETVRVGAKYGADSVRVRTMRAQLDEQAPLLASLGDAVAATTFRTEAATGAGAVVDGVVSTDAGNTPEELKVELVGSDGRRVGVESTTTETGYYALTVDEEKAAALAKGRRKLYVRVLGASGKEIYRSKTPVDIKPGVTVREPVTLKEKPVARWAARDERVIYSAPAPRPAAPAPRRTAPGAAPVPARPIPTALGGGAGGPASTPLDAVKGLGPAGIKKLRRAKVRDAEALSKLDGERVRKLLGGNAARVMKAVHRLVGP